MSEDLRYENPEKSLEKGKRALLLAEKANNPKEINMALRNIGNIYSDRSQYDKALKYYSRALKIAEQINDKRAIGNTANFIGNVYNFLNNADKALEYYTLSLKCFKELQLKYGEGMLLTNIGTVYMAQGKFQKAIENFMAALDIAEELDHEESKAHAFGNLATAYAHTDEPDKSIIYYLKALRIEKDINDLGGMAETYAGMADIYNKMGDKINAIRHYNFSLEKAKEAGYIYLMQDNYRYLALIYAQNKDYAKAYEYKELYIQLKDSIFNLESSKQIAEIQTQYETEKKEKEIQLLTKDKALKEAEVRRQRNTRNMLLGGALMLVGFAFWRVRVKQKTNKKLQEKNLLIEKQKDKLQETYSIIEEKNKDITDSIHYAQRIQQAILPTDATIKKHLPESFVFYKPKDIVSGDFYFLCPSPNLSPKGRGENKGERETPLPFGEGPGVGLFPPNKEGKGGVLIAACDCTGHGVPGAFMSMIGHDQLNHIILEKGITHPSEVLTHLNKEIKKALKQDDDIVSQSMELQTRDGMDIALVSISPHPASPQGGGARTTPLPLGEGPGVGLLNYAGAHRPLWIIRKNEPPLTLPLNKGEKPLQSGEGVSRNKYELLEYAPDKRSIGGITESDYQFKNHEITLQKGDTIYLFTDGYADQFGGENLVSNKKGGKKFMTKNLKKLLLSVQDLRMHTQKEKLEEAFHHWKGSFEQVDDVLIIGVRV